LFDALGLEQTVVLLEGLDPLLELGLDPLDRGLELVGGRDEVLGREEVEAFVVLDDLARERAELADALDLVAGTSRGSRIDRCRRA